MQTVNIFVDKYQVECKIRKVKDPLGDIILLTGATTFSGTYLVFRKYFKYYNLIIINTPGHGKTNGTAITVAEEYLEFYEKTILKLINLGHCKNKVNLLGYSLGGMTIYHLVNREQLIQYIDKSILLFSAYKTDPQKLENTLQRLNSSGKGNLKSLILKNFNPLAPIPLKFIPRNIFFASSSAVVNDFILCKSFNKLSDTMNNYKNRINMKDKYVNNSCKDNQNNNILIVATDDAFFHTKEIKITKSNLGAQFIPIYNKSHFSPIWRPKRYVRYIEGFLMDNH